LSLAEKEVLKRETGILKQCHHPNIVKFLGEFKTKTHIYIVTELLSEGDLFEYTKKNGFLEEYEAAIILKHLIDAILYLNEELGIIHRDLKPENVLVKMNDEKKMVLRVKLIDFGFGVFKDKVK
jgi:serine/threonine protein kinase